MPAPAPRPKQLASTFSGRIGRILLAFVAAAVLGFSILANHLLRAQSREFLFDQARLCAAALVPMRDGDLSESVARLQDRFAGLIAVGALDAVGGLYTVYPNRPAHRAAVLAAMESGAHPVAMDGPYDGKALSAVGIVVPLNGRTEAAAWKVLILLRVDSYNPALLRATAGFACLLALCALVSISALKCWFIARVVKPLWRLTGAVGKRLEDPERSPPPEPGEWGVTIRLAEHLHELLQRLDASDARVHSIESEIQRKVRKQVLGLDRQLRRAKDQASLDPLTRLRNRTFLEAELEQLFQRCRVESQDLAAVMMDVDNFKQYNDAHGHQIGDVLLRFVGSLLRGGIRPTDHAIRYGGDEFLLLLPETTSAEAGAIAERIVKLFAQYVSCLKGNHSLSMSAGVASLAAAKPAGGHALVAKADAALYVAKRKGKNTVAGHRTPKNSAAA